MRTGVIDLHSHILPGLDDGAPELEDSVAMAREAVADGILEGWLQVDDAAQVDRAARG